MRAKVAWSLLGRKTRGAEEAGRLLYGAVVAQARRPVFYTALRVPDTPNGRFELYSLHTILLLRGLKGRGGTASAASQNLFDTYVSSLDDALREQGVGDLSMAKKMRKLGEAFYGRVRSYDEAFEALPDRGPLESLLNRTVCAEGGDAPALTAYTVRTLAELAGESGVGLVEGRVQWPEIAA
jgi:cytochrome b pre-mRNA-processing protein 3